MWIARKKKEKEKNMANFLGFNMRVMPSQFPGGFVLASICKDVINRTNTPVLQFALIHSDERLTLRNIGLRTFTVANLPY